MNNRDKGSIGLNEIKSAFHQYLDFQISDQDILEFLEEVGSNHDGNASVIDFKTKYFYLILSLFLTFLDWVICKVKELIIDYTLLRWRNNQKINFHKEKYIHYIMI